MRQVEKKALKVKEVSWCLACRTGVSCSTCEVLPQPDPWELHAAWSQLATYVSNIELSFVPNCSYSSCRRPRYSEPTRRRPTFFPFFYSSTPTPACSTLKSDSYTSAFSFQTTYQAAALSAACPRAQPTMTPTCHFICPLRFFGA